MDRPTVNCRYRSVFLVVGCISFPFCFQPEKSQITNKNDKNYKNDTQRLAFCYYHIPISKWKWKYRIFFFFLKKKHYQLERNDLQNWIANFNSNHFFCFSSNSIPIFETEEISSVRKILPLPQNFPYTNIVPQLKIWCFNFFFEKNFSLKKFSLSFSGSLKHFNDKTWSDDRFPFFLFSFFLNFYRQKKHACNLLFFLFFIQSNYHYHWWGQ